jgi:hypothetical protein
LEQDEDPLEDFESSGQALREEWTEQDEPTWEKLYTRARKLVDANLPAMVPEDLSATTMADFRIKVNKALEVVLGWDWEEHIDAIRANKDGLFQEGDLKRAEMSREASMQRAQGGPSPAWPPRQREEPPPSPSTPTTFDSKARAKTADAIASDLIWEGEHPRPGEWQYLTTFGFGAHGQAQLWTGIRSDDHGMIIEVCVQISSLEPVVATTKGSAMMTARNETDKHRSVLL